MASTAQTLRAGGRALGHILAQPSRTFPGMATQSSGQGEHGSFTKREQSCKENNWPCLSLS